MYETKYGDSYDGSLSRLIERSSSATIASRMRRRPSATGSGRGWAQADVARARSRTGGARRGETTTPGAYHLACALAPATLSTKRKSRGAAKT